MGARSCIEIVKRQNRVSLINRHTRGKQWLEIMAWLGAMNFWSCCLWISCFEDGPAPCRQLLSLKQLWQNQFGLSFFATEWVLIGNYINIVNNCDESSKLQLCPTSFFIYKHYQNTIRCQTAESSVGTWHELWSSAQTHSVCANSLSVFLN